MKTTDGRFAQCIYFASNALARKTERLAIAAWAEVDLTPSHGYLLMLVVEKPGMQAGQVAEEMQLQPSTITRLVEKLEKKKLVQRNTEGKTTHIYPTPKGKELYPRLESCAQVFTKQVINLVGKDDTLRIVSGIGRIADKLK